MRAKLKSVAVFIILFNVITSSCMSGKMDLHDIRRMRVFNETRDLLALFKTHGVPVVTHQVAVADVKYFFVSAYPYSGSDTIDLYCYEIRNEMLRLVAFTYVEDPSERKLSFKSEADHIIVLDGALPVFSLYIRRATDK